MSLSEVIRQRIRQEGPLPFATYADLALYHPEFGYYTRAGQRSGRDGDFITSVDFRASLGTLLAAQFWEMWRSLDSDRFDLVEVGAGNGRLSCDILDAVSSNEAAFYKAIHLHLVERSPTARNAQSKELTSHRSKLVSSGATLPADGSITGVILANELLDAFAPHILVMSDADLREVYIDIESNGSFVERLGPLSSSRLEAHIEEQKIVIKPGWRIEVTPEVDTWVRNAVRVLGRGFLLLIDYGYEARELYSATHSQGTVATYSHHQVETTNKTTAAPWLIEPGSRDITAHINLTAVKSAAESAGATTLGILDQTYFLLGLGAAEHATTTNSTEDIDSIRRRLAMKSLLMPGGLGSTQKVMVFGKGVGTPELSGLSFQIRTT
ncbi:MAG: SAM-dependent methyltransferase [Acidobacteriota bacterium]|nr:SAM-dependent methyltransferase [Acidobacteriota bacterium]